jgi:hypothetical protein
MTAEDCSAYMVFLAELPEAWISRRRAARWQPGWTPFAGPLSLRSRQHAIHIAHGFFEWLVQAGYLALNPWRLGDDARRTELDSRAFTREAWAQLRGFVEAAPSRRRASASVSCWAFARPRDCAPTS